jgi:hypothetical protein
MIIGLDKFEALYIFSSAKDAESYLEAIDVSNNEMQFCDDLGHSYSPVYTSQPREFRWSVDIGRFRLKSSDIAEWPLVERLVSRARYVEYSSVPAISSLEILREKLRIQANSE